MARDPRLTMSSAINKEYPSVSWLERRLSRRGFAVQSNYAAASFFPRKGELNPVSLIDQGVKTGT